MHDRKKSASNLFLGALVTQAYNTRHILFYHVSAQDLIVVVWQVDLKLWNSHQTKKTTEMGIHQSLVFSVLFWLVPVS